MAKARYTHVMWAKHREPSAHEARGWFAERFSRSERGAGKLQKLYARGFETQVLPIDACPSGLVSEDRTFHPYDQLSPCKR